jgi:two-component system, OmpR family, response regulator
MPGERPTILLVEDDGHLRRLLSLALRLEGYLTLEASDGLTAISMLERFRVDAVILDLVLPGIDGIAVRHEMNAHQSTRSLPVIVITGSETPIEQLEPACLLRKPVTPDEVIGAVARCLRPSRTGRS